MGDAHNARNTIDALNWLSDVLSRMYNGEELFGQIFEISEDDQRYLAVAEAIIRRERLDLALSTGLIDVEALRERFVGDDTDLK